MTLDYVQMKKFILRLLWYIHIRMEIGIFFFYRNPGADMMLNKTEISEDILKETEMQISKKTLNL